MEEEKSLDFKKYKPKKNKITVPDEFLKEAKSYEDKLILVQHLTEKEKGRVLIIIKSMLKGSDKLKK